MTQQVNYDAVADNYNLRTEGGYLVDTGAALQYLATSIRASHILDLGCGTGRSLHRLNNIPQSSPIYYGLDFSGGMLSQAQQLNPNYRLVQASAPYPPFSPASFDLVFSVHAFHHFPHKTEVVRAAYNMLRPGGVLAIVNFDPRENSENWCIYTYFDGVYQTDLARFPAMLDQEMMLSQAGFEHISSPVVENINQGLIGEAIFDDYYLRKDSSSQLILLSAEAYQAGLERIRTTIDMAQTKGEQVTFQAHIKVRMCHGFKPT